MRKSKPVTHRKQLRKYCHKKKSSSKISRKRRKISTLKIPVVTVSEESVKFPRKRRTKGKSQMYFTQETEDAIILYNKTEDLVIREQIFRDKVLHPFQKLVENIFNTFKFSYFETSPQDVQTECLTHLVANMHKFDPARKSKANPKKKATAFAYFSIIAKHYLILLNNTNWKKFNQNVEISEERDENTVQLQQDDKYYHRKELTDFVNLVIEFWENNVDKIFTKQRDLSIANAVVHLLRNSHNISMYNKKALYLYVREIAGCKTQQITKVINRMKLFHAKMQKSYTVDGIVETNPADLARC